MLRPSAPASIYSAWKPASSARFHSRCSSAMDRSCGPVCMPNLIGMLASSYRHSSVVHDRLAGGSCVAHLPQDLRSNTGPFHHSLELGPGNLSINLATPGGRPEAAVGAGNHALPPDHLGIPHNALGHQLRVLN